MFERCQLLFKGFITLLHCFLVVFYLCHFLLGAGVKVDVPS
uniref:Uncharacterized protein n=1 Tax=Anguilla anguilla TaxID=7936 RepID=A0A0E9WMP1_ANGAN